MLEFDSNIWQKKKIMLYTGSQFVLVIYVLKMLMNTKEAPFFFWNMNEVGKATGVGNWINVRY